MNNEYLRLVYPQWQGGWPGNITACLNNQFSVQDATQGYYFGSQILNLIAPQTKGETAIVPINFEFTEESLKTEKFIYARKTIINHLQSARSILEEKNPSKVIVLGGECSVSVMPFSYMMKKYENDVAMVWIDAHPDLIRPGEGDESRRGFHEMPIPHLMGLGDEEIDKMLPGKIDPSKIIYVGLRVIGDIEKKRISELGMKVISPNDFRAHPEKLNEWLKSTGCKKTVIHLDLDVLEPEELYCAVGREPNGMKIDEVVDSICRVNQETETVALTVTEHMPIIQIKLRNMLRRFPMFQ
ncbi:arginase [Tritrichomonas foetus]|uniref:Arginase n=1 Tax=Tritrichomonas foetus TaxID=1144522 RepID=A0A1J4KWZ5_9EUKA|nr:arginase [Tritrichomonas foetus]|eukprot:OHT15771.1 arginase [Tritrichomonas foetus]